MPQLPPSPYHHRVWWRCQGRRFDVSIDPDDASRFFLYEVYDDVDALHDHHESTHFKAFKEDIVPWVASREATYYDRISDRA
ncbi:antibiotic biosynthesis monooxygenase [bacterium AH-315-O15]|nr:antibiotic biosynthesis monooxygenase [bacterium AH-315-O15]